VAAVAAFMVFESDAMAKEKKGRRDDEAKEARDGKAKGNKADEVTVSGKLTVTGKGGRLVAELQTDDGSKYSLALGRDVPPLSADMDGKTVTVLGELKGNSKAMVKKLLVKRMEVQDAPAAAAEDEDKPAGAGEAVKRAL
jgi:hypothetical protein